MAQQAKALLGAPNWFEQLGGTSCEEPDATAGGRLPPAQQRLLRQAYATRPDTEIAAHLGEVLWGSGLQDEARKVWGEGANRDPKNEALRETRQRLKAGQ